MRSETEFSDPCPALRAVPLDTTTISSKLLNIEDKRRSNLFPWNGQFSPQLVHTLLEEYAGPGDLVLDPFVGSGTVLVEAGRLGLTAFGAEINPAACKMAAVYPLMNLREQVRWGHLRRLTDVLQDTVGATLPILSSGAAHSETALKRRLLQLSQLEPARTPGRVLLEALIVLLDFYKAGLNGERVLATWSRLSETVKGLPTATKPLVVYHCDARALPLDNSSVDLVVTSPPYINVFNYHQQYRASAEALGWDLLDVARSEIGSNRKHRANRFLTVTQYCIDISDSLKELQRVCRSGARMVFVVGRESNVMKTRFFNGDIVARVGAECVGLEPECRQERRFLNRYGDTIVEDLVHFRNVRKARRTLSDPTLVASQVLEAALSRSPEISKECLQQAIQHVRHVSSSPIYQHRKYTTHELADAAS